ncbi:histidine phosphatase family protein, partial [Hansschlegelia beijingensis]
VVASPRERTHDTAAVIGADLGVPVELDEAFDEIDVGEWAGKRFDELAHDPRWRIWNEDRDHARAPGGETMGEVQARALGGLGRLADRYDERIVVVVSHADVIKSVLLSEFGMGLGDYWKIDIGPGEFGVLSREPGRVGPGGTRP